LIGIALVAAKSLLSSATSSSTPAIDNIQCEDIERSNFHIHAHLDIFINGMTYTVPSNIGIISGKCLYWMHTHDDSGVIHIESPVKRTFTLGQFFDIWNKKFSNNQIFDNKVVSSGNNNINGSLNVYVNGNKAGGTNYRDIKLNAHDEIAIVYGIAPTTIPSKYNFPEGL
jgi:hypothetical protein